MRTDTHMQTYIMRILLSVVMLMLSHHVTAVDAMKQEQALMQVNAGDQSPNELKLTSEHWDLARHGERLIQIPVLKTVVNDWSTSQGHIIELRYPGGEEGELWVRELMDWLISLGIPSQYLVPVPGSGEADVIKFQLIKTGESYR